MSARERRARTRPRRRSSGIARGRPRRSGAPRPRSRRLVEDSRRRPAEVDDARARSRHVAVGIFGGTFVVVAFFARVGALLFGSGFTFRPCGASLVNRKGQPISRIRALCARRDHVGPIVAIAFAFKFGPEIRTPSLRGSRSSSRCWRSSSAAPSGRWRIRRAESRIESPAPGSSRGKIARVGHLHSKRHHGPRRARARPQAPRHVHRRRRQHRAASPRLGDPRQLDRRGDERLRLEHRRHAPRRRRVDHGRRTTGAASRSTSIRRRRRARSRSSSRRCTPAASSTPGNYKTAGGLHGVGASVVNALSKELVATVKRDGATWEQRFKQGVPVGVVKKLGPGARHRHDGVLPSRHDDLPEGRVRRRRDQGAARGRELPAQGRADHVRGREPRARRPSSSTPRGWPTT